MVSINRNFGVKAANTQPPAQEAATKNDKNGATLKKPAYPQPEQKVAPKKNNTLAKDTMVDVSHLDDHAAGGAGWMNWADGFWVQIGDKQVFNDPDDNNPYLDNGQERPVT